MNDPIDLFQIVSGFVHDNFPECETRKMHDGESYQIRIDRSGITSGRFASLVSIYESQPKFIFYVAGRGRPTLGRTNVNPTWWVIDTHPSNPDYFDILSKAISLAIRNLDLLRARGDR